MNSRKRFALWLALLVSLTGLVWVTTPYCWNPWSFGYMRCDEVAARLAYHSDAAVLIEVGK